MYKLIAIDLDGTMLNSYGIIDIRIEENNKKSRRTRCRSSNSIRETNSINKRNSKRNR